ncbi:extracellular serine carboxypeptidase [Melampsora larici-populina 98AG31]|uniref:Extracellular serine carboxypeptidase n=1 Tax=Melampsora larici-populina (strain 98AG31 / pathotype 3-4-7) TaxID=747676 RepID=F4RCU9_MELLP|nr:extracellular serine carboxypeptidase [Melampsora larici-populina 98AG31]EGG09784.1 extracellular serine carboxypeptidase [Melampsora larici-populina 98AG31]
MFFLTSATLIFGWTQVVLSLSISLPNIEFNAKLSNSPVRGFLGDTDNTQGIPMLLQSVLSAAALGQKSVYAHKERIIPSNPDLIKSRPTSKDSTATPVAHVFEQKISHFPTDPKYSPHIDGNFQQRYWVDTRFYKPGGPVFLLDAGEISGQSRIPFLQQGIIRLLSETFHGVGLILEMRYYGASFPTKDLSTESLRFLDTKQSLADAAYFAQNIVFPGLESHNLTAPGTPWIYYGGKFNSLSHNTAFCESGSYAGAKAAYMKVTYPDLIWGAIGSSATVKAIVSYSDYFRTVEKTADPECVKGLQVAMEIVDRLIGSKDMKAISKMKADFGVEGLSHIDDFVSLTTWLVATYQEQNWDPNSDPKSRVWSQSCEIIKKAAQLKTPRGSFPEVYYAFANLTTHYVSRKNICPTPEDPESCFGTYDLSASQANDLTQTWRSWMYQCCREEAFFPTNTAVGGSSIVSRYLTLDYNTRQCKQSFPPGAHNRIPPIPDVSVPNSYGGYDIAADRLAFIDGRRDPWLYATPHSPLAKPRKSTLTRPFYLIQNGVHHYDENGLPGGLSNQTLPEEIRAIQLFEIEFITSWLNDFKQKNGNPLVSTQVTVIS